MSSSRISSVRCFRSSASLNTPFARRASNEIRAKLCPRRAESKAGCPKGETDKLGSVKLLQSLLNVAEKLDVQDEDANAFNSSDVPEGWNEPNESLSALFVAYDLRIADAHETFALALPRLQDLGFDTASLQQGYGRAIDFVMDKVIEAFENINGPLSRILAR